MKISQNKLIAKDLALVLLSACLGILVSEAGSIINDFAKKTSAVVYTFYVIGVFSGIGYLVYTIYREINNLCPDKQIKGKNK